VTGAAEPLHSLRKLETDVAAAEHDKPLRYSVQPQQRLARKRRCLGEARDGWDRRAAGEVDHHVLSFAHPRAAIARDCNATRRHEPGGADHKVYTAGTELLQVHLAHRMHDAVLAAAEGRRV
jgi:hypothetical protein